MKNHAAVLVLWLMSWPASGQIEVHEASIGELQQAMTEGEATSVQIVEQYLQRIAAYDDAGPRLNSIIRINPAAREQAAALDAERRAGRVRGPLHGIPLILKDNYNTDFMPTTGGSVALAGFVPSANATAVQKLVDAGAVILAKSNLHEFAYGITTISSLGGQTRNPYDPRRVPGGSSGGTAAAIAASFAAAGMGSDTCGSIRIPAAFNNLVGLRPSKGLTSIHGVMPLSHTQDVIGPLARNVTDLALVLDVVTGFDAADPATAFLAGQSPDSFAAGLNSQTLTGLRIGRLTDYFNQVDAPMLRLLDQALESLQAEGAEVVEVGIPDLARLVGSSGVIGHEFHPDLDAYLTEFQSDEVISLAEVVDSGLFHLAVEGVLTRSNASIPNVEEYQNALRLREDLRLAIETLLQAQDLDALVYPPITRLQTFTGENQPGNNCSLSANSGLPAVSIPVGVTPEGLPAGMELLGGFLDDVKLVSIAYQWERLAAPRLAPSTTPALINGVAPAPQSALASFSEAGVAVAVQLDFDQVSNSLSYTVNNNSTVPDALYAVTLVSDEAARPELTDPVIATLSGPQERQASGELVLSPRLRNAWLESRLLVKIFAAGLPAEGVSLALTVD